MSLALFIYDTIFSQKYLVVDILHCNGIYISNAFRLMLLCPCLRCLRDCVTEFNKNNRKYKIDKATVSHYMKSAQVTRYFHGNIYLYFG